jgi:glycosyltransferase involved in cell wall biosynthesis/L-amino acid N-acyltransferase YncA
MSGGRCDVTVTIATRNRADTLRATLDSLKRQKLAGLSWQVIVVDNGSSDDTADVLASAVQDLPLTTLSEPSPGKNRALNAAIDAARGDLLVFTDDDIVADPAWLQRLNAAATRWPDINIFGGLITPAFPAETPDWLKDPRFPHARWTWSTYAPRQDEGPTRETPLGPNVAFRRSVLDGVRWDESIGPQGTSFAMGSEVELLMRLARRGELFVFVPDARVKHVLQPKQVSESYLKGRAFRCGRGNARLFSRHAPRYPVLGVGVAVWIRLAALVTQWLAHAFSSAAQRKWIALQVRQTLGHMYECSEMRRKGELHGVSRLFPTLADVRGGFAKGLSKASAWMARGLGATRGVDFFCQDLRPGRHADSSPAPNVRMYDGKEHLTEVLRLLAPIEHVEWHTVEARLKQGDRVAIACSEQGTVGYAWATSLPVRVDEADVVFTPQPGEVVGYDLYVVHGTRGRGIAVQLDAAQMRTAKQHALHSQWTWVDSRNSASLRALEKMGKSRVGSLKWRRMSVTDRSRREPSHPELARRLSGPAI